MEAKIISATINPTPNSTAKVLFALNSAGSINPNKADSINTAKTRYMINLVVDIGFLRGLRFLMFNL